MNNNDRNNLVFFMNISPKDLKSWYDNASNDDLAYIMEILKMARTELMLERENELDTEYQLSSDYPEASAVLKKIMEKK